MDFASKLQAAWLGIEAPGSIFYWPYVVAYLAVTVAVAAAQGGGRSPREALRAAVPRAVYLSRAGLLDALTSLIYMLAFDAPLQAAEAAVFAATYQLMHVTVLGGWTLPISLSLPLPVEAGVAALVTLLAYDFATFVAHWASHRFAWLWDLHAVHHSATQLNPFSIYRDHPLDHLLRNGCRGLLTASALALLHVLLPNGTWGASVLGVGVGFVLFMLTVHLHHSPVAVQYPRWLRLVAMSPHLHLLHHSLDPRHQGKNLGVIFPFWDRLFGSYLDEPVATGGLTYGLGADDQVRDSLLRCYTYPFVAPFERFRARRRPAVTDDGRAGEDRSRVA